jgi:cysteinyl-tRNA synthetase
MHIRTVQTAISAMGRMTFDKISLTDYHAETQDILLPYLDSLYGLTIDAEDHSIFTKLTRKFEDRFTEDMTALNCLDPDEVTRVTEYVPQIVDFVKRIQDNSFAYTTSDGSVYFDIEAFEAAQNHYARLEPWNRNDPELLADGEGSLTKKTSEKRSDADFALWKSSKPGEPSWPSPWGKGRPGWHIECSAMASDKLGSRMDIHSGGIDLAFPHHDNELAQSEAFWLDKSHAHEHQWVNYFMHMGHLHIQGSKMSKSLKNFTTIKAALSGGEWTPRGLRIVFLRGGWREGIEITDDTMKAGSAWEDKVNVSYQVQVDIISGLPLLEFLHYREGHSWRRLRDIRRRRKSDI